MTQLDIGLRNYLSQEIGVESMKALGKLEKLEGFVIMNGTFKPVIP